MEYTEFDIDGVRTLIDETIAKFASRAIDADGNSVYEALVNYSRDENEIELAIKDSLASLQATFSSVMDYPTYDGGAANILIALPNHPDDYNVEIADIRAAIASDVAKKWFSRRGRADIAEIIGGERDSAVERLKHNLYRLIPVTRQ